MSANKGSLAAVFLAHLPKPTGSVPDEQELERLLGELLDEARQRWPEVRQDPALVVADLARRVPEDTPAPDFLRSARGAELVLAAACARGDRAAIECFEAAYFSEVDAALHDAGVPVEQIDEIKQILRERFFVGQSDRPPAVTGFTGRGSLRAWVRISAMREVYRISDAQKRFARLEEEELGQLASGDDVELGVLKQRYRVDFQQAVAEAMAQLTARQRNLLRHSFLDGMSIDQIGRLYQVHRSTAARWLAQAREAVLAATRELLAERLDLDESERDGLFRLVESGLDVSLRTLLASHRG